MMWSEKCPKKNKLCEPWANIVSDDESSFICCGESHLLTRSVPQDNFRLCFHNDDTDTCYDHDEIDLLDLLAVISDALALAKKTEGHNAI